MDPQRPVPAGTLGNADAAEALADRLLDGCDDALRMHLIHFAVRVARRASDAAACLARAGCPQAAAVAAEQARYIGALQHPLVTRRDASAARCCAAGADLLATARGPARGVLRQSAGDGRGHDTARRCSMGACFNSQGSGMDSLHGSHPVRPAGGQRPGPGHPIVFLHAGVCDRRMWHAVAPRYARGRTIAYDRRGYGLTRADPEDHAQVADLLAVLDALTDGEPAILVGASAGGRVALDMALPARRARLVLVLVAPNIAGAPAPVWLTRRCKRRWTSCARQRPLAIWNASTAARRASCWTACSPPRAA